MGNCLVTKLKGVVNNDSLPLLGQLTLEVLETSANKSIKIGSVINTKVSVKGDCRIIEGGERVTEVTLNGGEPKNITLSTESGWLVIENKYNLYHIERLNSGGISFPDDSLNYFGYNVSSNYDKILIMSNDAKFDAGTLNGLFSQFRINAGCYGDPSNFHVRTYFAIRNNQLTDKVTLDNTLSSMGPVSNYAITTQEVGALTNLTTLDISSMSGDIVQLATLTKVTILYMVNSNITGTVESFVEGMVSNGRTSGTINVRSNGSSITFHGGSMTTYFSIVFSNGSATVKNNDGSTIGTYNGSTWTYGS